VFLSCFDENAKNYRGLLIRQLDNAQINIVFGQNVGVTVPGEFDREMHIAIVKDGASYRIYADGLLVDEAESLRIAVTARCSRRRPARRRTTNTLPHHARRRYNPPSSLYARCRWNGSDYCGI